MATTTRVNGDLNNTEVLRKTKTYLPDAAYNGRSLAISPDEDDAVVRSKYRPFLQREDVTSSDWISQLELSPVLKMVEADLEQSGGDRLKVLVLYGSMRSR